MESPHDFEIPISYTFAPLDSLAPEANQLTLFDSGAAFVHTWRAYRTKLELYRLALLREYDELLCLETLQGVDHYWYQIETVKKVLKYFRGRVLLADEVGLGKTIEAGMLIKEYRLRGLIKKVLILTPPALVSQWQSEMQEKFDLTFMTTDQVDAKKAPRFWEEQNWIVASIHTAKSRLNFDRVTGVKFDLVVVDEAHHLRNPATLSWKLVNALQKKFIFLLTATPVQNDLMELHNLLTLLKPGVLSTAAQFRKEYVARGDVRLPKNREKLKELLREVMIRNTRSLVDVKLPKRFASTISVTPSAIERELYERISRYVRASYHQASGLEKLNLNSLLMKAGSCPYALDDSLQKLLQRSNGDAQELEAMLSLLNQVDELEKGRHLIELLRKSSTKKIVFTNFVRTFEFLADLLRAHRISFAGIHGGLNSEQKNTAVEQFRDEAEVLLMTEIGSEGRNLQFCRTMINYDLPWNPMRLEQRIGRIHRIGQTEDVFVFNFCLRESIEEHILYILDKKINMFELVIGEIDSILGNLDTEDDFGDIMMGLWVRATAKDELQRSLDDFADKILHAKTDYQKSKELDEALFAEEFEV